MPGGEPSPGRHPGNGQCVELTAVRHGQSIANVAFAAAEAAGLADCGITGPDAEVPLSDLGRAQAASLGRWLAALPPEARPGAVLCSPYLRARQTIELASFEAGTAGVVLPAARPDDRLRDRVMGDLELLTSHAVAARFPAEAARRRRTDEFAYRPPGRGGESFGDVIGRLADFLRDLHVEHSGRRVLVVAHDAVVLMLRHLIEGLPLAGIRRVAATDPPANASITRWTGRTGRLALAEYNAVGHLGAPRPAPDPAGPPAVGVPPGTPPGRGKAVGGSRALSRAVHLR